MDHIIYSQKTKLILEDFYWKARDEYRMIKVNSAKLKDININLYTDLKEPFVKRIFNKRINKG